VDTGFWIVKLLVLTGLLVLSFALPAEVFDGFRWLSLVVAGLFMIIQIVILIDFAYSWNEDWLSEGKDWKAAVLTSAVFGYLIALAAMVLLFYFFANDDECGLEKAFIGITIGLTLLFTLISISERCEHGAILPSAVCTVYCYWVLYSALSEVPDTTCNSFGRKSTFQIIMGFVIAAASVAYAAFNASAHTEALTLSDKSKQKDELLEDKTAPVKYAGDEETPEDKPEASQEPTEDDLAQSQQTSFRFQIIMASAACYACMLLTDWGEATNDTKGNPGMTSVWIQIGSEWAAAVLYTWSLVAPYVLTNRQF